MEEKTYTLTYTERELDQLLDLVAQARYYANGARGTYEHQARFAENKRDQAFAEMSAESEARCMLACDRFMRQFRILLGLS